MKKFIFTFFFLTSIYSLPQNPYLINGEANFITDKNNLVIEASDGLIINWNSFSIQNNEKVSFIQPSENSFVLNKVINDKSEIFGNLLANGKIFLLNPNGILIGKDATINVASFIASTLNLKNEDFLNKENLNFSGDSQEGITNLGTVVASQDVFLISKKIQNQGKIEAFGKIGLGSSNSVLIKPNESTSVYILSDDVDEMTQDTKEKIGLDLNGDIEASNIELKADGSIYDLAINLKGNIDATSLTEENGEIILKADFGNINILDSNIKASKKSSGGKVQITSDNIITDGVTKIDVSHLNNGGNVYIGGGKQGNDPSIKNAITNFVGKDVVIDASSKETGNGGEVIVWALDSTHFWGKIFANGGSIKGDGGFAEVSGIKNLIYEGVADLRVNDGILGTLLLDPSDITVGTAADSNILVTPGSPITITGTANTCTLSRVTLNNNLALGNVKVSTQSAFAGPNGGRITVTIAGGDIISTLGDLTLSATTNISFNSSAANIFDFSGAPLGVNFTAIAGDPSQTPAGINGTISFDNDFTLTFPSGSTGSATFTANGTGTITNVATGGAKNIIFNNVKTINWNGNSGITIGNNTAGSDQTLSFNTVETVNFSTVSGNVIFGNNNGNGTLIISGTAGINGTTFNLKPIGNIIFGKGIGAGATGILTFQNFKVIYFGGDSSTTVATTVQTQPPGANNQIINFTNILTTEFKATDGITLGQNTTAFSSTLNFGNGTINMSTSGVNKDITFGGATGSGSLTINGGGTTSLNVNPTGAININGIAAGTTNISSFGTINFYPVLGSPTSVNLINFVRPTIAFNSITNFNMYPYNVVFNSANTSTTISNSNLTLIKTIAPLTTIPNTLTLATTQTNFDLQAEDILINGKILNSGPLTGYIYLTSNNDIKVIASAGTNISARVGTILGDVKINCLRDLIVQGGNLATVSPGGFAQIGYGTNIYSDIYLTVGRDINILGGTAATVVPTTSDFACIGHGEKNPLAGSNYIGNIIINSIGRDLNLTAGGTLLSPAEEGIARLGHGAIDDTAGSITLSGNISGPAAVRGIINGNINITGGVGEQCHAHLGHKVSNISSGTAHLSGNILLQCTNLNMLTQASTSLSEMYSGMGFKVRYTASGLNSTIDNASVDTIVLGDVNMTAQGFGGAILYGAYINDAPTFTSTGTIDLSSVNLNASGFINIMGATTLGPQENKVIIGVYSDFVNNFTRSNLNIESGSDLSLISRTGDSCFIINGQTPTLGRTMIVNAGQNLYVWGQLKSAGILAIDTLNIDTGRNLNMFNDSPSTTDFTSIESNNTMNINIGKDLTIAGFGINVDLNSDFGFAIIRNNSSTVGDMTIIANDNITINPYVKIKNLAEGKTLTLVIDNAFPTPFQRGNSSFDMNIYTFLATFNGPIRIFTVDQSLNNIVESGSTTSPKFNNSSFVKGPPFINSDTEIWGVYYPSTLGGFPFTFFYKTFEFVTINSLLQQNNNLFIPFFEIFYRPFARFFDIIFDKCQDRYESVCFY